MLTEVHTGALDIQRPARLAGRREAGRVRAAAARGREELAGRAVINVFSRGQFAWDVVEPARRAIISPSIDALTPKNQELADGTAAAILEASGLRAGAGTGAAASFVCRDGSRARVRRRAELDEDAALRPADRYVLQVSRWDRLKDPLGVIAGFTRHVAPASDAHLVYAGPDVGALSDDPEGAELLAAARALRRELPSRARARVHLAVLPMEDLQENSAIVNALQRSASVVVQKSLAEGFGLTVAEAMWKGSAVVASRIGGIGDQIEHRRTGLLLDNPSDMKEYAAAVRALLEDPAAADALGAAARERVRTRFLGTHSLVDYLGVIEPLLRGKEAA